MTITAFTVTLIVGHVIPLAVALVTRLDASAWLKQLITAVLSAATGLLVTATQLDGTAVVGRESLLLALGSLVTAQAAYVALWRPHAVNAKLLPTVGL